LIDPQTGGYWASADDLALYMAMLELAGGHARHLYRITCVYNLNEVSEASLDRAGQRDRARRIRKLPRYEPLDRLTLSESATSLAAPEIEPASEPTA
jgi:hypothetical protein